VRTGLSAYAEVFRSDGAADEEALALYSMEDEEVLEKLLAAAGCPRLNRRLLIDALRALRKARTRACSVGSVTPGAASSSASSGMSSIGIMPTPLVDTDGEEWLPLGELPDKVIKKRRKVQKVSSCSYAQEVQLDEARAAGKHRVQSGNVIERAFSRASQASWEFCCCAIVSVLKHLSVASIVAVGNFMARLHYSVIQEKSIKTEEKEVKVTLLLRLLLARTVTFAFLFVHE